MATDHEIETVFNLLTVNYSYIQRDKTPDDLAALLDLWKQLLADIDGETLRVATLKHISESKWFPSIAEIREQAASILNPAQRSAVEAWGDVVRAFHTHGYNHYPQFEDEITAAVVKSLGWVELCQSESQEADRARFIQGYEAIAKRKRTEAVTIPLVRDYMAQIAGARRVPQIEAAK